MKDWLVCLLGPLLGEVVKNMKDKRDGRLSAQQKVFVYSAVSSVQLTLHGVSCNASWLSL